MKSLTLIKELGVLPTLAPARFPILCKHPPKITCNVHALCFTVYAHHPSSTDTMLHLLPFALSFSTVILSSWPLITLSPIPTPSHTIIITYTVCCTLNKHSTRVTSPLLLLPATFCFLCISLLKPPFLPYLPQFACPTQLLRHPLDPLLLRVSLPIKPPHSVTFNSLFPPITFLLPARLPPLQLQTPRFESCFPRSAFFYCAHFAAEICIARARRLP